MSEYVEILAIWRAGMQPTVEAKRWVTEHGLTAIESQSGLLIAGSSDQLVSAFGTEAANATAGTTLPVPSELRPYIETIVVPGARDVRAPGGP